jgi:hypothetical protein
MNWLSRDTSFLTTRSCQCMASLPCESTMLTDDRIHTTGPPETQGASVNCAHEGALQRRAGRYRCRNGSSDRRQACEIVRQMADTCVQSDGCKIMIVSPRSELLSYFLLAAKVANIRFNDKTRNNDGKSFYPIKLGSPVIVFRFSEYTCIVEFRAEPHAARLARIATCIAVNAG